MPSSNAGPDTAGPDTITAVGTTPEQAVSAAATRPQACRAETPSLMSAPDVDSTSTSGRRRALAADGGGDELLGAGARQASRLVVGVELGPHDLASVEVADRRADVAGREPGEREVNRSGAGHRCGQ